MADESLSQSYEEVIGSIVQGNRFVSSNWVRWFDATTKTGTFVQRIAAVFQKYGVVPTPEQFWNMQHQLSAPPPPSKKKAAPEPASEPEPDSPESMESTEETPPEESKTKAKK